MTRSSEPTFDLLLYSFRILASGKVRPRVHSLWLLNSSGVLVFLGQGKPTNFYNNNKNSTLLLFGIPSSLILICGWLFAHLHYEDNGFIYQNKLFTSRLAFIDGKFISKAPTTWLVFI